MKKLIFAVLFLAGCSSGNLEYVKERSTDRWKEYGMQVVSYEGFEWGFGGFNNYGGAKVWYRLKTIPDNGITYTGFLQRWGDEIHIYGPKAIDAIRP